MVYHRAAQLDRVFAGLADPTRRAILQRLARGDRTISELASRFDMTLPAVSKHVRVLERAGLARVQREGRSRRTHLVAAPLREARNWIERYRRFWEFQFDQLAAYLEDSADLAEEEPDSGPDTDPKETIAWQRGPKRKAKPSKSGAPSRRRPNASSRRGRGPRS
jgi:DNA-binding transcriptional ArsR family regulator